MNEQKKRRTQLYLIWGVALVLIASVIVVILLDTDNKYHSVSLFLIVMIAAFHLLAYKEIIQFIERSNEFESRSNLLLNSFDAMDNVFYFVVDRDFNYLLISEPDARFMKKYFNVTPEIGRNVNEYLVDETLDQFYENMRKVNQLNNHVTTDHFVIDGKDLYLLNSYYTLHDSKGEIYAISCVTMDVSEQINEKKTFIDLVYRDTLTDVYNRRKVTEFYNEVIIPNNPPTWIILMDLNNFKFINDTYGHIVGDRLLIELSIILTEEFPKSAIIARMGGDEFCVLITRKHVDEINSIIERVHQRASEMSSYPLSLALGYCLAENPKDQTFDYYYTIADENMFKNKNEYKSGTHDYLI